MSFGIPASITTVQSQNIHRLIMAQINRSLEVTIPEVAIPKTHPVNMKSAPITECANYALEYADRLKCLVERENGNWKFIHSMIMSLKLDQENSAAEARQQFHTIEALLMTAEAHYPKNYEGSSSISEDAVKALPK